MSENDFGSSAQTFLTSAEKRLGNTGTALVLVALGIGAWLAMPAIVAFLTLAVHAVGLLLVLAAFGVVSMFTVLNPRFWTILGYWKHDFNRWLTTWAIKVDPIGKLKTYVEEYLQQKWNAVKHTLNTVRGSLNSVMDKLEQNEEDQKNINAQLATLAKRRKGNQWQSEQDGYDFQLASVKLKGLETSHTKLDRLKIRLELLVTVLEKMSRALDFMIKKTDFTVQQMEIEFEATRETATATRKVAGLLGAGDDQTKVFRQTVDFVTKQTNMNIAEIESFMNSAGDFLREPELESESAEQEMLARLNAWDAKADELVASTQQDHQVLSSSGAPLSQTIAAQAKAATTPINPGSKYVGLMRK